MVQLLFYIYIYIKYKLCQPECMEYLVKIGLDGLKRVLSNQQFTESNRVLREIKEYEENNNPIVAFLEELDEDDIFNQETRSVYTKYYGYCAANSLQPMSNIEFSKYIKKQYDCDIAVRRIDGKPARLFIRN